MNPSPRTLILVGGTDRHVARAADLDVRVVLLQHPDKISSLQTDRAHTLIMADYTDWDTIRPLAEAAHRVWPADAVVSLTEGGLLTAARLREHLGTGTGTGTPSRAVAVLRDKQAMRAHLDSVAPHLTVPAASVTGRESLAAFAERAGYPFIVKPTGTTAGFGLQRVDGPDGLDTAWRRIRELTGARTDRGSTLYTVSGFLMEAWIDGPEYSVETFSFAGRHVVVAVTEKLTDDRHFAELGHAVPARLDDRSSRQLHDAVIEFLTVTGVTDGPGHTEVRMSHRGPVIVESHNRVGGGQIGELVRTVCGLDLTSLGLAWPLGMVEPLRNAPPATAAACARFLLRDPGTVLAVHGAAETAARPDVLSCEVSVGPGDRIRPVRDNWDRLGHVAVRAATTSEAVALCERLAADIVIDVAVDASAPSATAGALA